MLQSSTDTAQSSEPNARYSQTVNSDPDYPPNKTPAGTKMLPQSDLKGGDDDSGDYYDLPGGGPTAVEAPVSGASPETVAVQFSDGKEPMIWFVHPCNPIHQLC